LDSLSLTWPKQLLADKFGGSAAGSNKQYLSDKIRTLYHMRKSMLYVWYAVAASRLAKVGWFF
jgi:hypothetical protein